jgi:hypothetical protein
LSPTPALQPPVLIGVTDAVQQKRTQDSEPVAVVVFVAETVKTVPRQTANDHGHFPPLLRIEVGQLVNQVGMETPAPSGP